MNKVTRNKQKGNKGDVYLLAIVSALSVFGAIMIYSGSVLVAIGQNKAPYHFFLRQLIWIMLGIIAGYIMYRIDYKKLPKLAPYALAGVILLLVLVLVLNHDKDIKRWIDLGIFDLQPSELAKLAFLIYLSSWLAKQRVSKKFSKAAIKDHFLGELLPFLILLSIVSILILVEPDLDTTVILGATSFIVYFMAGDNALHFLGSISIASVLGFVTALATGAAGYRIERLNNWRQFFVSGEIADPFGSGYQLRQILVAVASGGLFGVGFGESRQKFHYLGDTAFSDTIFAILAEEFGLMGSLIIILMFVFFLYKGYQIAKNAPDKLGFLLAVSITTWITLQAFLHIASNVALIPINGNTLPFISYGGSSTIINLAAIGLLLNISKYSKAHEKLRSYR